jgi:hypothetical protein
MMIGTWRRYRSIKRSQLMISFSICYVDKKRRPIKGSAF